LMLMENTCVVDVGRIYPAALQIILLYL